VTTIGDISESGLTRLLARLGLSLRICAEGQELPGSYWGVPEAGLIGNCVYASAKTPVHSVLHEACHYLCMTPARRRVLDTNAGGDYDEENCVCFMQIILADFLPSFGRARMLADMNAWGYTFRLGSAQAWFEGDAEDVRARLQGWGMLDHDLKPTWRLRGADPARAMHIA